MERIQKILANSNIASRRKAELLILAKRVKVNGKIVTTLGTKVSPQDVILVDDKPIQKASYLYFLLHKPSGYITSVQDDKKRPIVLDLIKEEHQQRLYPVGRLDFKTEGLLIITNDGALTQKLTHPSSLVPKEYHVQINHFLTSSELKKLTKGIMIDHNYLSIPREVHLLKQTKKPLPSTWLSIAITEGKNRQIRKMMEEMGFEVLKLKRYRYDFLTLDHLPKGKYRSLTKKEVKQLLRED
ncbi:MAG: pseudouridine synthase ['Conium maculatum' witches'-broom phytoplasma]|nr:pseudouridine synthase ['Conium maculatum' witches'-broom phytoplasma]